jgi:alpha-galactosidase
MSSVPSAAEMSRARQWFDLVFSPDAPPPLSFDYDGLPASELLAEWSIEHREGASGDALRSTLVWTDPASGLQVRVEARRFADLPAVEWIVHLTNTGSEPTPIITDLRPLDWHFPDLGPNTVLHWAKGSDCQIDDFAPQQATFYNHRTISIHSLLGRSSHHALPFFNLQSEDHGVIGAIGWTGSWRADFIREEGVRVRAGMPETHLRLLPGESIRTPRMLLLLWQGQRLHGHNMLRRLILERYTPRVGDAALRAPVCNAVWGENLADNQIAKARWWVEHDLPLEYFWIDAGWYGDGRFIENSTVFNSEWGQHVGNWWPNRGPYPEGLAPVGQALADMGLGFVLWFEPERVFKGTHFTRTHPEWLLGPVGSNHLFNLGIPEARQAMTDLMSDLITEAGVTCYRQDFNTDPAPFWEAADGPDRVGMSEIRHIEGLYAMWDELLARHPGLMIDNCSSGGRRIDLETISRSIPLWRSDYQCFPGFDPVGMQAQTHGLALWVPLSAGCCDRSDTYAFRSALSPGMVLTENIFATDAEDFTSPRWMRAMMDQHLRLRPYLSGDFYPLLGYSLDNEAWAAWQFHRPDLDQGCVIAFRRPQSAVTATTAQLQGMDAQATYEMEDLDEETVRQQPGTKLLVYRRQ